MSFQSKRLDSEAFSQSSDSGPGPEGFWTSLKPRETVHSVTVLCDFKSVLLPLTDVSPLVPIPIIGYVQSQSSTAHAMTKQFQDAPWTPVSCGLADQSDFLRYISLAKNTAAPLFKISVFGELRLNNGGLLAAGENRKVALQRTLRRLCSRFPCLAS